MTAKATQKVEKRPVRRKPEVAGVAEAVTRIPNTRATEDLPSELAVVPIASRGNGQTIGWTSLVLAGLIGLALGLAVLASMSSNQLAALPASSWIAERRLSLVIGGMGVLMGAICVLLINAVFGP